MAKLTADQAILDLLAASEPSTFTEILYEVRTQVSGVTRENVVPETILALARLINSNKICKYADYPLEDSLDYAWVRSEEY